MKVHYLQHVAFEGLGYIETWLRENGHQISGTHFFNPGFILPGVPDIDALIIMGGPMSVYDEHLYPWLKDEKKFIERCLLAGKKILGICLGAQLIAVCLGARVGAASHKEIGWFPVMPAEECKGLSWFYELFKDHPVVFHWHGEMFDIPGDGSLNLLFSEANRNQAFCRNQQVIGLQFHLEVTEPAIQQMLNHAGKELTEGKYIQSSQKITGGIKYTQPCNNIMSGLLKNWLITT